MDAQIYYFSGTGNSLHVARELKRRMPSISLVPIIGALKEAEIKSTAETVGIIFPIHAHTIPAIVKDFLKKVDLSSANYVFAMATRYCADKVFKVINRILKKKNQKLNASFAVNTPVNYIPVFSVPTTEEINEIELVLQENLDEIQPIIEGKKEHFEKSNLMLAILANTLLLFNQLLFQSTKYFGMQKSFYADEKCIGCGTCENICLSGKIKLVDKKPVWQNDVSCVYCFACISYCPKMAIQAKGKRTKKKGRYQNPNITAKDIASQKNLGNN